MKWQGRRKSSNVGRSKGGVALGGGGLLVALIVFLITGSPRDAVRSGLGSGGQSTNKIMNFQKGNKSFMIILR